MNSLLIIAVHPDDETLGAGGTLLKYKDLGYTIHWLIVTSINDNRFSVGRKLCRENEIETVSKMYGFSSVDELNLPTMQLDEIKFSVVIEKISEIVNKIKPEIIILPFKDDVHSDHRVVFNAAYSCTKTFRYPFIKQLLMMETLSETEFAPSTKDTSFIPNVFVDVSNYIDKKINIMKVFESELGNHPFPRSLETIEALAKYRGAMSGCKYAESFMLLKDIR
jgi:LmbE family N-acetylglucosaminyl deacetylase